MDATREGKFAGVAELCLHVNILQVFCGSKVWHLYMGTGGKLCLSFSRFFLGFACGCVAPFPNIAALV